MRNIKTREGFEFWDKLNALPRYAFLLSPTGKSVQKFEDQAMGNYIDVHEAQKIVEQAEDRISERQDELGDVSRQLENFRSRSHGIKNLSAIEARDDQLATAELKINELQKRLTAGDERWDELVSAVRSINYGPAHKITVPGDDEPQYLQRKEWIDWVLGLCDAPKASAAATCTWSECGFSWHTGCGKEWQFTDGGLPSENGMRFCHSCGKTLVVDEDQPESERES